MNRRHFLRAVGACVALPCLGRAAEKLPPRRLVAVHVPLGMMPQYFFPKAGEVSSPYLDLLAAQRGQLTVFSGLSHPGVDGNHHAGQCFLTGAPHPGQPTFRNSLSLDQLVAEKIGLENRFPSLALAVKNGDHYGDSLAVSRSGVGIPAEASPQRLYRSLFVAGTPEEKAATLRRIEAGGSVLDLVLDKAARLEKSVASEDRARLDQYFQSVRELEGRLERSIAWENRPKPKVDFPEPKDIADANLVIEKSKLMFDLIRLALQTDSTRVVTLSLSTFSVVPHVQGVKNETHGLTHHGNEPEKIAELRQIEEAQISALAYLLQSLRETKEAGASLLDQTQVLYGSCLGNANSHSNQNLPVILAGGGFKHGRHLAFDTTNNTPLANLFVTMLQRLGLETGKFASSTGTLTGLEPA
ncbi:MAG: DUF1552 domain-containing protein [Proteobacteria bacterium]|nr:DUF1552 domain-containing protein [Pseudomonadota bacterium]